jgi:hypothetical protein
MLVDMNKAVGKAKVLKFTADSVQQWMLAGPAARATVCWNTGQHCVLCSIRQLLCISSVSCGNTGDESDAYGNRTVLYKRGPQSTGV